jgi:hypothetical protein
VEEMGGRVEKLNLRDGLERTNEDESVRKGWRVEEGCQGGAAWLANNKDDTVLLGPYLGAAVRLERVNHPVCSAGTRLERWCRSAFLALRVGAWRCWSNTTE